MGYRAYLTIYHETGFLSDEELKYYKMYQELSGSSKNRQKLIEETAKIKHLWRERFYSPVDMAECNFLVKGEETYYAPDMLNPKFRELEKKNFIPVEWLTLFQKDDYADTWEINGKSYSNNTFQTKVIKAKKNLMKNKKNISQNVYSELMELLDVSNHSYVVLNFSEIIDNEDIYNCPSLEDIFLKLEAINS